MSYDIQSNNKRIAKNTFLLYIRMFITMVVSLYTSRVVLDVLGIENYGVYNVVGGVVSMMAFFNSSMATSTQRFLNYEMVQKSSNLSNVFVSAVNAHFIIAIFTTLCLETFGLWFIEMKLNIPEVHHTAAIIVFHCSVLSFFISVISTPYSASIVAHEDMGVYAYFSIGEVVLKLLIVYLLCVISYNKLIVYAFLTLAVSVFMPIAYNVYCVRKYPECRCSWFWNWSKIKQLFSFTGWMVFGCVADMFSTQGVNMLINIYFGPIFNAASGVAVQVRSAVEAFSTNFMTAVKPQIIKSYSSSDFLYMLKLVYSSSKLSFLLLLALITPILVNADTIINIWLKEVPPYAVLFCQITLIDLLIRSSYAPIAQINQASGKIRTYQIVVSMLSISIFLISLLLYIGELPVYITYIVSAFIAFWGLFVRLLILQRVNNFPAFEYLRKVTMPMISIGLITILSSLLIKNYIEINQLLQFCLTTIIGEILLTITAWTFGLNNSEKAIIVDKIHSVLKNKL